MDLPPDRYRVRIERAGRELYRATPQDVPAGGLARFDIYLKGEDLAGVMPRIQAVPGRAAAAPGDIITLAGTAFTAEYIRAAAVPLPIELNQTQVVVNGQAAPLFYAAPDRIELQLPYETADEWTIVVRNAGLESAPFRLAYVAAEPVILGIRNAGNGYLEIYATGLGAVDPPLPAGLGGGIDEPLSRTVLPVAVLLGETELQPLYAGLTPWYPGRYQVNVRLPAGVARGSLQLRAGGRISAPAAFAP